MTENRNDAEGKLRWGWMILMAWRDSRRNRARLVLFIVSVVLGIAALVASFSFGANLEQDIDRQAKTLIGADLAVNGNRAPGKELELLLDSLGKERSEERSFASMIYFPKSGGTRLVQVRALRGDYPYYGSLETVPENAGREFRTQRAALVDKTLMLQYNAQTGDSIRIGDLSFVIAGVLNKSPGRTGLANTIAAPVFIPLDYLAQTGLEQKGSRITYQYFYKFSDPLRGPQLAKQYNKRLEDDGYDIETVQMRKERTGRSFADFNRFLTLTSFIALLLGCIGVASAIQIYIREKIPSIAVLRCLGVQSRQAFLIFLIQVAGIGLLGSILGAGLGLIIQQFLPFVFRDILPIEMDSSVSWPAVVKGLATGVLIAVLFALIPLVSIRRISPLHTLRLSVDKSESGRDYLRWGVYLLLAIFVTGFTWWQTGDLQEAFFFTLAVIVAVGLLSAAALLLMTIVRKFFPQRWNYLWRQGFANLYRPNNQTVTLITTIGLGTAFIGTLMSVQHILLERISLSAANRQPNMLLFDIQTTQKDSLARLAASYQLPVMQQVPIVTMRMESINGITAAQAREDSSLGVRAEAFEWEFRVTYRDSLTDSEKLKSGKLQKAVLSAEDTIYVSIDERYAQRIRVGLGDRIVFNVQGLLIPTVVGSMREVDWNRVQTNFRVLFPPGVLERAPQFHVLVTRVPTPDVSAAFQQAVVRSAPNVSIIDLGLILKVVDDVLSRIGSVIRFMAGFSILTGFIVLIASVLISKFQRIQETVLLRTLGASRRQVLAITALEYFFLGGLAALTGILISLCASLALASFSFETPFRPHWLDLLGIFGLITGLTVLIGLMNSRSILQKSPLEVLRKEV